MNVPVPKDKLAEIEGALRQGQKILAIKLYRECTGVGLAEAKLAVEDLERGVRPATSAPASPGDQMADVREAVFRGEKIQAIRLYRQHTGTGLAEAKSAVERLEADLRSTSPDKFTASSAGKGCLGMAAMICGTVVAAVLWFSAK